MIKSTSQEIIRALKRINKCGRSEISADTYIRTFYPDEDASDLNRSLAFAELMSRLAPRGEIDAWYTAGLLYDISGRKLMSSSGGSALIIRALLTKARILPGIIYAIEHYRDISDPTQWTPIIAAMNYADAHITPDGRILTTPECCKDGYENKPCNECMYARYIFAQRGVEKEVENATRLLQEDLKIAERKAGRKEA